MDLDLARASERFSYFTGRFYELGMQLLLMDLVRAGDRVVDIGANVGEISLLCSRLVGPTGVVDAFEPNLGGVPTDSPPRSPGIASAISSTAPEGPGFRTGGTLPGGTEEQQR